MKIPVLTYHSIDASGSPISVSAETFDRHMAYLRRSGYESLPLSEAVTKIRNSEPLPKRAVIITFDDGYKNNYTVALPILRRHGYTATVFVATDYCGGTNDWPDQKPSIPSLSMMTWDELRKIRRAGIEVGAHTCSHPRLSRITEEVAIEEMRRSKAELEERLDEKVDLFSYPYGDYNAEIRKRASKLFAAAISNRPGYLRPGGDLYTIGRFNVSGKLFRTFPMAVIGIFSFGPYLMLKKALDARRRPAGQ